MAHTAKHQKYNFPALQFSAFFACALYLHRNAFYCCREKGNDRLDDEHLQMHFHTISHLSTDKEEPY